MNDVSWLCLRLLVRAEYSELASQALREAGCDGIQIEDTTLQDRGEDADFIAREEVLISGYFEQKGDDRDGAEKLRQRVQQVLDEYSVPARVEVEIIDAKDWANLWQENFPPLQIGPFLLAPSWEDVENRDGQILIRLDPGLAFGTGQHPTTQMCLELLGEHASSLNNARLLDVGCGSGVLSIAASKLGARVTASDLDPHCIAATRENAAMNAVEFEIIEAAGLDWCEEKFDVIIANLMSDLLINLAPQLRRVGHDKSTLIVSGISSPRADDVEAALTQAGFSRIEKREREGELRGENLERWAAFVFTANRNFG
jgi:ribosomal protein L11 methyltransferase